jgi:hypothetical protein
MTLLLPLAAFDDCSVSAQATEAFAITNIAMATISDVRSQAVRVMNMSPLLTRPSGSP